MPAEVVPLSPKLQRNKGVQALQSSAAAAKARAASAAKRARAIAEDANTAAAVGPVAGAALAGAVDAYGLAIGPVRISTAAGAALIVVGMQQKSPMLTGLGAGMLQGIAYRLGAGLGAAFRG